MNWNNSPAVMPALVAGIHVFAAFQRSKAWMAGTSPAMTNAESASNDREPL
jgi:hypothetical protein